MAASIPIPMSMSRLLRNFFLVASAASAETWIGTVSNAHCTPDGKALPGDDPHCVIFIANDRQVYTIENQDAVKPHVGHEVVINGSLNRELIIGVSYESQGIIHADSVKMISAMQLADADRQAIQTRMKGMQPLVNVVRNTIYGTEKTPLPESSAKLAAAFDEIAAFFKAHPSDDAEKLALEARDAAKAVGTATVQVEQVLALRKVTDTCAGCHLSHRAGKTGAFVVQP